MEARKLVLVTTVATCCIAVPLTAFVTWRLVAGKYAPLATPSTNPASVVPIRDEAPAKDVPASQMRRVEISSWAAGVEKVAAADLNGDGVSEIALGTADNLRIVTIEGRELASSSSEGSAGLCVLEGVGDSLLAGWGQTKAFSKATAAVTRYVMQRGRLVEESVAKPASQRPQVVSIASAGPDLLVSWFTGKYNVGAYRASRTPTGWTVAPWMEARTAPVWLATDLDEDGREDLVYGRTYGDAQGSDGDAWIVRGSGERVVIPTTRGVRAGCLADTDGDGRPEIVLADGWDKDYGRKARQQLRLVRWEEGGVRSTIIDQGSNDVDTTRVLAEDVDGDRRDEVLAVTDKRLRVVEQEASGWVAWDAAPDVVDAAVIVAGSKTRIVVVGRKPEILDIER